MWFLSTAANWLTANCLSANGPVTIRAYRPRPFPRSILGLHLLLYLDSKKLFLIQSLFRLMLSVDSWCCCFRSMSPQARNWHRQPPSRVINQFTRSSGKLRWWTCYSCLYFLAMCGNISHYRRWCMYIISVCMRRNCKCSWHTRCLNAFCIVQTTVKSSLR